MPFTDSQRNAYANLINEFRNAQGATPADMVSDMGEDEDLATIKSKTSLLLNKGSIGSNGSSSKRQKISEFGNGEFWAFRIC